MKKKINSATNHNKHQAKNAQMIEYGIPQVITTSWAPCNGLTL